MSTSSLIGPFFFLKFNLNLFENLILGTKT